MPDAGLHYTAVPSRAIVGGCGWETKHSKHVVEEEDGAKSDDVSTIFKSRGAATDARYVARTRNTHCRAPRLSPHRDPFSGEVVQSLSVLVQGREHRRHLHDVPHELPQRRVHGLLGHVLPLPVESRLSVRVLGVGLVPQQRLRAVPLASLYFFGTFFCFFVPTGGMRSGKATG